MEKGSMQMNIREMRKAAGMSQAALAARTGIDRTRICFAESGYVNLRFEENDAIRKAIAVEIKERTEVQQQVLRSFGIAV
jgi:transcriptional regulator with XRE-family HTH domain